MKHLLIIALLLSSTQGNAQVSGPPDSNLHIISGGKVIFPPGTIIYPGMCSKPPDSGSGGHITFSIDLGSISHHTGYLDSNAWNVRSYIDSAYIWHYIYRDTSVYDPAEYAKGKLINSFTYKYRSHDTEFVYNHFEWLIHRCREERYYWNDLFNKETSIPKYTEAAMQLSYYSGMEDMLIDILYHSGEKKWHFKSKDKSKRRTK